MDINRMLAELRQEHAQLGDAILSIERLALGRAKRRGRPPAWLADIKAKRGPGRPAAAGTKTRKTATRSE
jgi:hypothetical protein